MGSGSFPLRRGDTGHDKLTRAAGLLDEVIKEWAYEVYSGDSGGSQYDNAANDGEALGMLRLAARLIREQVDHD